MVALHHSFWKGNWVAMARTEKTLQLEECAVLLCLRKIFFFKKKEEIEAVSVLKCLNFDILCAVHLDPETDLPATCSMQYFNFTFTIDCSGRGGGHAVVDNLTILLTILPDIIQIDPLSTNAVYDCCSTLIQILIEQQHC